MNQRFQHGLLNDIFSHLITASKATDHSVQKWKMLRDGVCEVLLLGHEFLELRYEITARCADPTAHNGPLAKRLHRKCLSDGNEL